MENLKIGDTVVFAGRLGTVVELPRKIKKAALRADEPQYRVRFGDQIELQWVRAEMLRRPANGLQ